MSCTSRIEQEEEEKKDFARTGCFCELVSFVHILSLNYERIRTCFSILQDFSIPNRQVVPSNQWSS